MKATGDFQFNWSSGSQCYLKNGPPGEAIVVLAEMLTPRMPSHQECLSKGCTE